MKDDKAGGDRERGSREERVFFLGGFWGGEKDGRGGQRLEGAGSLRNMGGTVVCGWTMGRLGTEYNVVLSQSWFSLVFVFVLFFGNLLLGLRSPCFILLSVFLFLCCSCEYT